MLTWWLPGCKGLAVFSCMCSRPRRCFAFKNICFSLLPNEVLPLNELYINTLSDI